MKTIALDSQIVSSINLCELRTNLAFMKNLRPISEPKALPLERGELIHVPLKVYYSLLKRHDKYSFEERVEISTQFAKRKAVELDLEQLECSNVIDNFIENVSFWHEQGENWSPVQVEQPFSIILFEDETFEWSDGSFGLRIIYEGIIDLVVESYNQNISIVDHKSTSQRTTPLELSYQFMGYCYALGQNTLTVNMIGLQKPVKYGGTVPVEKKHTRHIFNYTQESLIEWRILVIKTVVKWIRCIETDDFMPNYNSCKTFNTICPYYSAYCKASPSAREWNLETKFLVTEKWDVFKRDESIDRDLEILLRD